MTTLIYGLFLSMSSVAPRLPEPNISHVPLHRERYYTVKSILEGTVKIDMAISPCFGGSLLSAEYFPAYEPEQSVPLRFSLEIGYDEGGLRVSRVPFFGVHANTFQHPIKGYLGLSFLRDYAVKTDHLNSRISFYSGKPVNEEYVNANFGNEYSISKLPISIDRFDTPSVTIKYGDRSYRCILDYGLLWSVLRVSRKNTTPLPQRENESLHNYFTSEPTPLELSLLKNGTSKLPPLLYCNPSLEYLESAPQNYDSILSLSAFPFDMLADFPNGVLYVLTPVDAHTRLKMLLKSDLIVSMVREEGKWYVTTSGESSSSKRSAISTIYGLPIDQISAAIHRGGQAEEEMLVRLLTEFQKKRDAIGIKGATSYIWSRLRK